jgi:hypothetical protein
MSFSRLELAECAYRELTKRRENYPRWVYESKMSQKTSDDQIAKMEAIYRVLINLPDEQIEKQG